EHCRRTAWRMPTPSPQTAASNGQRSHRSAALLNLIAGECGGPRLRRTQFLEHGVDRFLVALRTDVGNHQVVCSLPPVKLLAELQIGSDLARSQRHCIVGRE